MMQHFKGGEVGMVTRKYKVENLIGQEIRLGRVGEHNVRTIEFDVSSWLNEFDNDGYVVVFVTPPCDAHAHASRQGYLAPVSTSSGIISWTVRAMDTACEGNGTVELIMYGSGNRILQSAAASTKVYPSSSHHPMPPQNDGCNCRPSNPNQSWVDQVAHMAYEAQDAAYRAEEALESVLQISMESELPSGGNKGQALIKLSDRDRDVGWVDVVSKEDTQTLQDQIDEINERVGNPATEDTQATGIYAQIEALAESLGLIDEDAVNGLIDAKIEEFAHKITDDDQINTIMELIDYVNAHGEEAAKMLVQIDALNTDVESVKALVGETPVIDQFQQAIAQENFIKEIALNGVLCEVVDGKVDLNIEQTGTGVVSNDEIVVNEDGTLSIVKIDMSKLSTAENAIVILNGGSAAV